MGYRSGQHGRMLIKNTDITEVGGEEFVYRIRNWSINYQQSVLDTTCLGDYDRTIWMASAAPVAAALFCITPKTAITSAPTSASFAATSSSVPVRTTQPNTTLMTAITGRSRRTLITAVHSWCVCT